MGDSQGSYSPIDSKDENHYCKKCNLTLEEGTAYELGNDRWHVDCFRCSSCNLQLDSDTNLLILGNGLLVCNNCSYRCHVCNKKIEDLAILTGDQAFCSSCFCCRNCKKMIEDLQYARTSQGIFCMNCHEILLERKKQNKLTNKLVKPLPDSSMQSITHNHNGLLGHGLVSSQTKFIHEKSMQSLPFMNMPLQESQSTLNPSLDFSTSSISTPRYPPNQSPSQSSDPTQPWSPCTQLQSQQQQQNASLNILASERMSKIFKAGAANETSTTGPTSQYIPLHSTSSNISSSHKDPKTKVSKAQWSNLKQDESPSLKSEPINLLNLHTSPKIGSLQKNPEVLMQLDGSLSLSSLSSSAGVYLEEPPQSTVEKKKVLDVSEPTVSNDKRSIPERSQLRSNSQYRTSLESETTELSSSLPISRSFNRPRKNSAPIPVAPSQNPYFPLGDTKANQSLALLHQRSVSDANKISQNVLQKFSFKDSSHDEQNQLVTSELAEAKKKIAELNAKLSEPVEKNEFIFEKQKTIAGLEAQNEIAAKELKLLEQARCKSNNLNETSTDFVSVFTKEILQIKLTLQAEIDALVIQRDKLIEKNSQLLQRHEKGLEDIELTTMKNNQLLELHKELARQIIDKYGNATKLPQGLSSTKDSIEPLNVTTSGRDIAVPSVFDEPLVTILEDSDERKEKQQVSRRFWKRPTAAVAKGVKGFNKVFSPENTPNFIGPTLNSESPKAEAFVSTVKSNSSSSDVGGNISIPIHGANSKEHITRNKSKNGSYGWPKNEVDNNESLLMNYPLEKRIQIEKTKIPLIVTRCIQEVEMRGMLSEGIYRKSGARSQIVAIEDAFEKTFDLNELDQKVLDGDIAGVTSVVKQYLRYLPVPLIHIDLYDKFVAAASITEPGKAVEELHTVINALPRVYFDTLQFVISHLVKVAKHSKQNLMTSRNLAVCFAPTIVRHEDGSRELKDLQQRNDGTQLMIDYYSNIFADHL